MELDKELREKVLNYRPERSHFAHLRDIPLLFIVGISGAGKNAISTKLITTHVGQYHQLVTHVTRQPRKNNGILERNSVDYHFVDMETASQMLDNQSYIEANIYSNNVYGTSMAELEAAQREHSIIIGDIDVNGVANFVRLGLHAIPVFVLPPSYAVWQQRLLTRYPDGVIDQQDWLARLKTARAEIQHALDTEYFYFVVNDELDKAVDAIDAIAHDKPADYRPKAALDAAHEIIASIDDKLRNLGV